MSGDLKVRSTPIDPRFCILVYFVFSYGCLREGRGDHEFISNSSSCNIISSGNSDECLQKSHFDVPFLHYFYLDITYAFASELSLFSALSGAITSAL